MSQRETINISITPEQKDFLANKVASGSYLTTSEVVRDALRLMQEEDRKKFSYLDNLKLQIQQGLDSLNKGLKTDGEKVLKRLLNKIEEQR